MKLPSVKGNNYFAKFLIECRLPLQGILYLGWVLCSHSSAMEFYCGSANGTFQTRD